MSVARAGAWFVHFYTASGAAIGFLALDAIAEHDYGTAFLFMALALFVDCTDGTLARHLKVRALLPNFDGARLDDIVDYLNYVVVPLALAYRAGLLPPSSLGLAAALTPLFASGYGFCQADAKTPDHYFKGFPSYWNIVVLYLYVLRLPAWANAATLFGFSALVFVPIRYLYPSRAPVARRRTYALGISWAAVLVILLLQFPHPSKKLAIFSLYFPLYYFFMSFRLHAGSPPTYSRAS